MRSHANRLSALQAALLCALTAAGSASADQWSFVGARYQAMGGTGVSFAADSLATYYNPANLAWKRGYELQLPVTVNLSVENDALERVSNLVTGYDGVQSIFDNKLACRPTCTGDPTLTQQDLQLAMGFLVGLSDFGLRGEAINTSINLGLNGRYDNFGLSALSHSTATIYPNTDFSRLGLPLSIAELATAVGPGTPLDLGLRDSIVGLLDGTGTAWDTAGADALVRLVEGAGANTGDPNVRNLVTQLALQLGNSSLLQPNSNASDTGVLVGGLSTQEFGFSYADRIPLPFRHRAPRSLRPLLNRLHKKIALGGTAKYMLGMSFRKVYRYDTGLDGSDILTSIADMQDRTVSHNFGLDLGINFRPWEWLQLGMVVRNVNSPAFDIKPILFGAVVINEIEVPAQVRFGISLVPIDNFTLAFDFDATENTIPTLPFFTSRIVSVGGEYVIPLGQSFHLALRVGGYNNVSDMVNSDWAMTGGVGLRFWRFVLDASAGASLANERVRTGKTTFKEIPSRINAGLNFKLDWSI